MKRKVNKVGTNTLTVSLPQRWVTLNKIKKGDEVDLMETSDAIVISRKVELTKMEIVLDLKNITSELSLFTIFDWLYLDGYTKITLQYGSSVLTSIWSRNKHVKFQELIEWLVGNRIGYEITDNYENYCIIEQVSGITDDMFQNTFRRSYLLFLQRPLSR